MEDTNQAGARWNWPQNFGKTVRPASSRSPASNHAEARDLAFRDDLRMTPDFCSGWCSEIPSTIAPEELPAPSDFEGVESQ